jgi:ribosome-associated heat shock protein Hsp15
MTDPQCACRLDIWLWRARFFKTRTLAAKACETGHIRLIRPNGTVRVQKAGVTVRVGDHLLFAIDTHLHDLIITGLGERRGPASEAMSLYARLDHQS